MSKSPERQDSVCVVGAGPHGLIVGRALKKAGVPFVILEKNGDVGGLWDMNNPGSPMYETCHFVSSKSVSSYYDFPLPDDYPDYPSQTQIHKYVRSFAEAYGLRSAIEFNSEVVHAEPDGERWIVETADGRRRSFEGLIVCPGCNWHPRMPELKGDFDGQVIHSIDYKSPRQLEGKRVLVVGLGNSGADIACDAARRANKTFVSVRRGYHFMPKLLFGVPTLDAFVNPDLLPEKVRHLPFPELVELAVGDVSHVGFPKPDHALGATHPVLNTQVLEHAAHGRITAKPDIERLDGKQVRFVDGSVEDIDLVICATGYKYRVPFIDEQSFGWEGEHPRFYLTSFIRQHPTLFIFGLFEVGGSPWPLNDQVAFTVAEYLADRRKGAPRAAALREWVVNDKADLQEGATYVKTARNVNYVHVPAYDRHLKRLVTELGYTPIQPGHYDSVREKAA